MSLLDALLFEPDSKIRSNENDYETQAENIFIPKGNSERLHGWLFRTNLPVQGIVVQMHGNAENVTSHACYASWMTRLGFDVLCWDYSGYGRSSGRPTKLGVITDAMQVLTSISAYNRGTHTILLGQSVGASILLQSLNRMPDFKASLVVLDGAFANYRNLVRHRISSQTGSQFLGKLVSYLFSNSFNAEDAIDAVKCPLLCIHSRADQIIPFDEHMRLFQRSKSAQKTFWESAGQKHLDTFRDDTSAFREDFSKYVKVLLNL